jgi:hypothetical protein
VYDIIIGRETCSTHFKDEKFIHTSILVVKPGRTGSLGKPRRRVADNIRMDLREIWWKVLEWNHVAQDREQWQAVVKTVTNLRVP